MNTEATPTGSQGAAPASVRLAERYEIRPAAPLPELAAPLAAAYAATDMRNTGRAVFALACPRHLGLRDETLLAVRRLERAYVLRPLDWGIVDWPAPDGGQIQQPVIVLERPGGSRLVAAATAQVAPMSEDAVVRRVLRPLVSALRDLQGVGVAHRGIRPDNLFWREGGSGEVVLGEAWSAPPGFDQPVLCETIPHGMAHPAGRGWGRAADDLYSLGASLAILLNGGNPVARLDDDAVIAAKITQGSFAVLAGGLRLSAPVAEILRGLLSDNPHERWTLDDLELWFDGRRLSPKAPSLPLQAARPVPFAGTDFWSRPALAHGLATRWRQATGFLQDAGIGNWLKRSLSDDKRGAKADAIVADPGDGRNGPDRQLARLLMILDPAAPLRYRDFAAHVEALGGVLAHGLERTETVQQFAQIVAQKLTHNWVDAQEDMRPEHTLVRKTADMLNFFLGRPTPGFGIERCLYESNPGLPCRSPLFERDYVSGLKELLPALNRAAQRGESTDLIDRHVAAFIGARLGAGADAELTRFGAAEAVPERCIGLLRLLATVQASTGVSELPALGGWVAGQLKPLVDSFHHRPFKEALAKEIDPLCHRGDFAGIVRLVENDDLRRRDNSGFEAARKEYAALSAEAQWIRAGGMTETDQVLELARQAAAVAAGTVATLACGATVMFIVG